ncbi:MAG: prepilin-type N-terminal cleavage/methylation domain-containing protein [Trueperaceae bacterium]|nr:prepilin-type N-terminal cleavage/methylation domain-containing protein [Trueperaceae bacterium]
MTAPRHPRRRGGFTLLEVLVALALAAVVAASLAALLVRVGRTTADVGVRTDRAQRAGLAAALLRGEVERAGRGQEAPGLTLTLQDGAPRGDRVTVRYLAEAHRVAPAEVDATFFAATDSAGRPNLYRKPPDGVRQPWLLGVEGVHVVGAVSVDGRTRTRAALSDGMELRALDLRVALYDGEAVRLMAATRRAGPVAVDRPGGTP